MENMKHLLYLLPFLWSVIANAQPVEFVNPLDGELILSGNFGEVRGNHFHSGLDLKTGGTVGKPVYSIADGYISRIAVSPTGFGKAIYINHPQGKTSVYAHLHDFAPAIAAYVKEQQYAQQSFRVNLQLPASLFPVTQGQQIALSGNSGSSGGPHVHFEIRETDGQIPENPLKYGFEVKDTRHPELQHLWLYTHSPQGHIEGLHRENGFKLRGSAGRYTVQDTIRAHGAISFGVAAIDRFTRSNNVCGIYGMTVKVNGQVIHQQQLDAFPFSKKRMVNCHVDYDKRVHHRHNVYRSYIAPGNTLNLYPKVVNRGVIWVEKGASYRVELRLTDHAGNASTIDFVVLGQAHSIATIDAPTQVTDIFYPAQTNSFTNHSVRINMPQGCLYDTLAFMYNLEPPCTECISAVHSIGHLWDTPLDKYMTVSIKMDKMHQHSAEKAVIVSYDKHGKPIAEGGTTKWNWITTRTRSFGKYAVMIDSMAPQLRPKNFKNLHATAHLDTLMFHVKDNLAGIDSYTATLNGAWVLLEFDPKNNVLYYVKDNRFLEGQNTLRLRVSDKVNNISELNITVR